MKYVEEMKNKKRKRKAERVRFIFQKRYIQKRNAYSLGQSLTFSEQLAPRPRWQRHLLPPGCLLRLQPLPVHQQRGPVRVQSHQPEYIRPKIKVKGLSGLLLSLGLVILRPEF